MKQTAVQFLQKALSINLTHEQQVQFTGLFQQALEMERNQHGNTWDAAIQAYEDRGHVQVRAWCDFDEYEIE
jgi:hypothetical protein